ncbi:MAG: antitoxin [Spirochaetaceae bacterium]|nr:MAG: antitoxin [Spirochaetaceae bacterium]
MANLQVKDIDEKLYERLRRLAANDRRSISQEVVHILQKYLSKPDSFEKNPAEEFLALSGSWEDDRSADEIISDIHSNRRNSRRYGDKNELFD